MANEVLVGLRIGAAVSGSLQSAFGSARSTMQLLGRTADSLTTRQKLLGAELAASLARGGTGIEKMRSQYTQLGRTIDQLKVKQENLNASIARQERHTEERGETRGQIMETLGNAAVVAAPVVISMKSAIDYKDQTNDIAITGGFDQAKEESLSNVMRGAALKWNQTQEEVAKGTAVLIAGGISNVSELEGYAPIMAKTATATRASMDDLGSVAIALNDNLGIGAAGLERSMNMLAFAGKSGQFELADMAKWLPQLTPQFAALGITGERAVAEIGASLQIARKGAGSNDEAANNFKNFMSKITAADTLKSFKDAGIDLQDAMKNLVSKGMTPMQAMLDIITQYMSKKGPKAAADFEKVMAIKDDTERETALARLNESYKLGELFADQQVLAFIRPAIANRDEGRNIQKGSMAAAEQGVLDQDWARRMQSPKEQLKLLTTNLNDVAITVGTVLLPALVDVTSAILPVAHAFSNWAGQNPEVIKGTVAVVGALFGLKLGILGVAYGANLVMAPFLAMNTMFTTASAKWTLLKAQMLVHFPAIASTLSAFGSAIMATPIGWIVAGIAAVAVAGLLIYKYWDPIKAFVGGFFTGFMDGIRPIGTAFSAAFAPFGPMFTKLGQLLAPVITWFKELLTPVDMSGDALGRVGYAGIQFGQVVGSILSGLLAPLRWVLEGITALPDAFSGGLGSMAAHIANFSPLGLFYRAFAGVSTYFGIELPAKFTDFGGMIIDGLITGLGNKLESAKNTVVGIGSSIKDWFTETLGIQSPSRVFMGYGANISEGAAIGISSQAGMVRQAALGMASESMVEMGLPNLAGATRASMTAGGSSMAGPDGMSSSSQGSGLPSITYAPVISVPGGEGVGAQVGSALQAGYADFVKFMERYMHDQARRSYGPAAGAR